jgi:hypothetical protein
MSQLMAAKRSGKYVREIQNAKAFEGLGHDVLLS